MRITRQDESSSSIFPSVISVPFPDKKYQLLLGTLDYENDESLQTSEYRKIFVNTIYRFLTGAWSLDDLASVADHLWFNRDEKFDDLGSTLYECAELNFYVRNIYNPLSPRSHGQFDVIHDYYYKVL